MSEKEYHQFYHDCQAAIIFLTEQRGGIAVAALHHHTLGDIDLVWGREGDERNKGHGLAKIIKFHPEVVDGMQEIFNRMILIKYKGEKGFDISDKNKKYIATVRINYYGKDRRWLMTMFQKNKAPKK